MKSVKTLVAAAVSASFAAGSASAVNLLANGGFEAGTGTDADGWQEVGNQPAQRDNSNVFDGDWALKLSAVSDGTSGPNSVGLQNSIADGGQPGAQELTSVDVSFYWDSDFGPGGVGSASARILDGSGAIVDIQNIPLPATSGYQLVTFPTLNVPAFGAPPTDTYAVFVEFVAAAGAFQGSASGGYVDNVVAEGTFVPEPTSLALLGLGGLLVARRRRSA